jgi:hypothetical protein
MRHRTRMNHAFAARRALLRSVVIAAVALSGCVSPRSAAEGGTQGDFMAALARHCGKAYAGRLVSSDAADADMAGRAMVVHFRECSPTRMAIPFHVAAADGSWDRSRTWLITRVPAGLRLAHDHRHADGSSDAVTMYGGETADRGHPGVQVFPVDAQSIATFRANGLDRSVTNVWRVEVTAATYAYQLSREGRLFRVEFDLTKPVAPPPAPWGW